MNSKCIITRYKADLNELNNRFPAIEWIHFPLIFFSSNDISQDEITQIEDCEWLIFTSQNAVESFFNQVSLKNEKKIAAVGPKTSSVIQSLGHKVDFIPSRYTSGILAEELPISHDQNVCYVGGNLSSSNTIEILQSRAKKMVKIEVYQTKHYIHPKSEWQKIIESNPKVISFASPSSVDSYIFQLNTHELVPDPKIKYAAIGSTTAETIEEKLNQKPLLGEKHTYDGMLKVINQYLL